jgi:hypothetical protein
VETRHDNRLRNRNIEYHVHFPELPATAAGTRFLQTVLDPAVGAEVVLVLVDQTDFAHQLAHRNPFELRLKTGAVRTAVGPLAFLLWWVPPVSDGMPFALYEHLLNPTERSAFEMVRKLSAQTHLHVLLIGPGQEVLDCYEFENTFECDALLPLIESAMTGPALDLEAAKREYEQMYDLRTLFKMEQMEPPEQNSDAGGEDGEAGQDASERGNAIDWSMVELAAKLAFDIWMGQPELIWAKKAFEVLVAAGLVEETDAFSRHLAFFRVLVLGGIYRDFCDAAWGETSWIDYSEWYEPDGIVSRFVIGQLFARTPDWDADEEVEFSVALDRLVEAERDIVVEALLKGFDGTTGLYASLWQSRKDMDPEEEFEEDDCFEPDDAGKLKAYEWVTGGCPRMADLAE